MNVENANPLCALLPAGRVQLLRRVAHRRRHAEGLSAHVPRPERASATKPAATAISTRASTRVRAGE